MPRFTVRTTVFQHNICLTVKIKVRKVFNGPDSCQDSQYEPLFSSISSAALTKKESEKYQMVRTHAKIYDMDDYFPVSHLSKEKSEKY